MEQEGLKINKKTYITTVCVLLVIIILAGVLTQIVPQGQYAREILDGRETIVPDTYTQTQGERLPVWRWLTAPFEVLFAEDGLTAIVIIVFILLIGGTFMVLDKSGLIKYMLSTIVRRYEAKKYTMLRLLIFVCMILGSAMGIFEESVPLVPIMVALSLSLGWDSIVGLCMSVAAVGIGFSSGTLNPFTVGITQSLAQLPAFSGLWFRIIIFVCVYIIFSTFVVRYAKKIEKTPEKSFVFESDRASRTKYTTLKQDEFKITPQQKKAAVVFLSAIGLSFAYIITGLYVEGLSDYAMPVMAVMFTAGGLAASRVCGFKSGLLRSFFKGMLSMLPSVLLILLALSAKQIMTAGGIMDTILYWSYNKIAGTNVYVSVIMLLAFILLLEIFIAGASSKAFLIMPIVVPLADMIGLTRQTAVQAYIFGDGFTDLIYPTNALLLISLGIAGVPYIKWFKWVWKVQVVLLVFSILVLWAAVALGYGPF